MNDNYEVAKRFWQSREDYPNYPNTLQRRFIDTSYVLPWVVDAKSLVDLGCGDGSMIIVLREFTKINTFFAFDISQKLLDRLVVKYGNYEDDAILIAKASDFTKSEFPKADATISMGSFLYVFEYEDLNNILANIRSNTFIVRVPCTMKSQDEYINTYSEDLGSDYSAVYRTTSNYFSIFSKYFTKVHMERAYSDDIESKYGTKHYFFRCDRR